MKPQVFIYVWLTNGREGWCPLSEANDRSDVDMFGAELILYGVKHGLDGLYETSEVPLVEMDVIEIAESRLN